ncbi:MAG: hypothetical protein LBT73_01770 [Tannerellaceae bacterium]|jgi:hypothetical protein|nr:hypothetical protein [Tannerellaceae bacterium]
MLYTKKVPLFFVSLLVIAACFACENKEEEPESKVVVRYIRFTDPSNTVPLLRAPKGSTIAFVGEGLEKVCGVSFNGIKAVLNPVFVTSNSLIVTIPSEIPDDITHTIHLYTTDGLLIAYFPFIVELPPPVITYVSDLQAADSVEVTLYGAHFYTNPQGDPPGVTFTPELEAEVLIAARDCLVVRVPMATQQGAVTVTTEYGKAVSPSIFRDTIPEKEVSGEDEIPVENDLITEPDA